jgi:hypothetical protein
MSQLQPVGGFFIMPANRVAFNLVTDPGAGCEVLERRRTNERLNQQPFSREEKTMKRLTFLLMVASMVFVAASVQAEQRYPLGGGNVALKVDYLRFTDSEVKDLGLENAVYIGAEAFVPVWIPNLYLGVEAGYAWSSGDVDILGFGVDLDLEYVPIEFNAKYVFELNPCLTFDLGAGISYNYLTIDASVNGASADEDDWLFGGQFFADVNYKMGQWFVGGNVKYQITEDISLDGIDTDVSASNFRVGGQVGFMF